jgi:hypothetical protein
MSRPFKSGVDFFPLDVVLDDKVKILEAEQDIVGFAVWVKLHQKVYASNYWINWDKKAKIVFSNDIKVDINKVDNVINSCLEWEIFDENIFNEYSILTSRGIQKRYFYICKKRLKLEIVEEYTLIEVPKFPNQEIIIVDINLINVVRSTQSKVKESKVKESKKTPLSKKPKRVFPDDCVEMEISKYLFKVLLKSDKNNKKPNFQNWCLVVDSILRLDNRSKEDTMKVIDYAHDPANSKPAFSWIPNLRSPTALRKHFTKILIQANVVNVENTENPALTKQEIADLLK